MEALAVDREEDIELVQTALSRLDALPIVKKVFPIKGARPGVQAQLWCSAAHSDPRAAKEQAQTTRERSILGCVERVEFLVQRDHSNSQCLAAAEAARAAAAAEAAVEAGPSVPTNAFQAMQAARQVGPAVEKAEAAERLVAEARRARAALEAQLAEANAALEAAQTELCRLEEEADSAREAAGLARKKPRGEEADANATYRGWTLSKWNELETKEQKRRELAIDLSRTAIEAPPGGDDTRGWHNHWRRGVYGTLRSWAGGSQGAVVYMLATAAKHFGVVKQVSTSRAPVCEEECWMLEIDLHVTPPTNHLALVPCLHSLASILADAGA
jgi:hypothetical protein